MGEIGRELSCCPPQGTLGSRRAQFVNHSSSNFFMLQMRTGGVTGLIACQRSQKLDLWYQGSYQLAMETGCGRKLGLIFSSCINKARALAKSHALWVSASPLNFWFSITSALVSTTLKRMIIYMLSDWYKFFIEYFYELVYLLSK